MSQIVHAAIAVTELFVESANSVSRIWLPHSTSDTVGSAEVHHKQQSLTFKRGCCVGHRTTVSCASMQGHPCGLSDACFHHPCGLMTGCAAHPEDIGAGADMGVVSGWTF